MKVRLPTIDVSEAARQAMMRYRGRKKLAKRVNIVQDLEGLIYGYLENLVDDYGSEDER